MTYRVERNIKYDFAGQSYASKYPNLHRYPATMLPQIGIEVLKELKINSGVLLDPYCGSGSSFSSGLEVGIKEMHGYDLNPLAVLISKSKFTLIDISKARVTSQNLRNEIFDFMKDEKNILEVSIPDIKNIDYWFSPEITNELAVIKYFIEQIKDENIKSFFKLPFAETVRDCSYTRNSEFKLFRMKPELLINFNPNVLGVFFSKLKTAINIYEAVYYPKLKKGADVKVNFNSYHQNGKKYDIVLTSPPYGDSKTTVAYGQFSNFANEWLDYKQARQVDKMLMGGNIIKSHYNDGLISEKIIQIAETSLQRSYEVSSFYRDLEESIKNVAESVVPMGYSIYVVGNRIVKSVKLDTDQFIAEKFEKFGFEHLITYERLLGNKSMPSKNSPTNVSGKTQSTMTTEYIVICQKK